MTKRERDRVFTAVNAWNQAANEKISKIDFDPGVSVVACGHAWIVGGDASKPGADAAYHKSVMVRVHVGALTYSFTRVEPDITLHSEGESNAGLCEGEHELWIDGQRYRSVERDAKAPSLVRAAAERAFDLVSRVL